MLVSLAAGQSKLPVAVDCGSDAHTPPPPLDADVLLRQDENVPAFAFRFPDVYGDDLRNERFRSPSAGTLKGAWFVFPTRHGEAWTTGNPDLVVKVWSSGEDSLPALEWISDTIHWEDYSSHLFELDSTWRDSSSQKVYVDLAAHGSLVDVGTRFHIGYTAILNSPDDSLAILSDDGSPASYYASEWYDGRFVPMSDGWPAVDFFIRAVIDVPASGEIELRPEGMPGEFSLYRAWPNPFNARTRIQFTLNEAGPVRLAVYDVLGRERIVLMDGYLAPGSYDSEIDATGWSTGLYFVRLSTRTQSHALRLLIEK